MHFILFTGACHVLVERRHVARAQGNSNPKLSLLFAPCPAILFQSNTHIKAQHSFSHTATVGQLATHCGNFS
jgi:hypothetical protein